MPPPHSLRNMDSTNVLRLQGYFACASRTTHAPAQAETLQACRLCARSGTVCDVCRDGVESATMIDPWIAVHRSCHNVFCTTAHRRGSHGDHCRSTDRHGMGEKVTARINITAARCLYAAGGSHAACCSLAGHTLQCASAAWVPTISTDPLWGNYTLNTPSPAILLSFYCSTAQSAASAATVHGGCCCPSLNQLVNDLHCGPAPTFPNPLSHLCPSLPRLFCSVQAGA